MKSFGTEEGMISKRERTEERKKYNGCMAKAIPYEPLRNINEITIG